MTRFSVLIICGMVALSAFDTAQTQTIRPIRDDIGFCWDAVQMKRLVDYLEKEDKCPPPPTRPLAAISPHDDYLYAGRIYYSLFKSIRATEAIIIGLTHGGVRKEIGDPQNVLILDDFARWPGLSGSVGVSPLREILKDRLDESDFIVSNQAHQLEHSIEALVPFLQYFNPMIRITPIMVTAMPQARMESLTARLADIIKRYLEDNHLQLGPDVVILISSDANHYGEDFNNSPFGLDAKAHERGTAEDIRLVRSYLTGSLTKDKIKALTGEIWGMDYRESKNVAWCGRYSIPFGLLLTEHLQSRLAAKPLKGRLLRYSDTYSEGVLPLKKMGIGLTAPFSLKHWVGFFSLGYY